MKRKHEDEDEEWLPRKKVVQNLQTKLKVLYQGRRQPYYGTNVKTLEKSIEAYQRKPRSNAPAEFTLCVDTLAHVLSFLVPRKRRFRDLNSYRNYLVPFASLRTLSTTFRTAVHLQNETSLTTTWFSSVLQHPLGRLFRSQVTVEERFKAFGQLVTVCKRDFRSQWWPMCMHISAENLRVFELEQDIKRKANEDNRRTWGALVDKRLLDEHAPPKVLKWKNEDLLYLRHCCDDSVPADFFLSLTTNLLRRWYTHELVALVKEGLELVSNSGACGCSRFNWDWWTWKARIDAIQVPLKWVPWPEWMKQDNVKTITTELVCSMHYLKSVTLPFHKTFQTVYSALMDMEMEGVEGTDDLFFLLNSNHHNVNQKDLRDIKVLQGKVEALKASTTRTRKLRNRSVVY